MQVLCSSSEKPEERLQIQLVHDRLSKCHQIIVISGAGLSEGAGCMSNLVFTLCLVLYANWQ